MLITGGYNAGTVMLKIEKKADGSYGVTEVFKNPDFGAHTQPPILHNGHFYAQCSTNERNDGFKSLASAVVLEPGDNWAPLALAGGKLLIRGQYELKVLQVAAGI